MRDTIIVEDAGQAIKIAMIKVGTNQTDLAQSIGITRQSLQQSINRKSANMRVQTMRRIVNGMGYDLALIKKD